MAAVIPEKFRDLLTKPSFANLATLMPDGQPQLSPVWNDFDGRYVWINTARGRQKDRNLRRNPRVSLCIMDPENPYRYLEVRGRVAEITEEGADAHIDRLAQKYLNLEKYPYRRPGEVRVIFKIEPEYATGLG